MMTTAEISSLNCKFQNIRKENSNLSFLVLNPAYQFFRNLCSKIYQSLTLSTRYIVQFFGCSSKQDLEQITIDLIVQRYSNLKKVRSEAYFFKEAIEAHKLYLKRVDQREENKLLFLTGCQTIGSAKKVKLSKPIELNQSDQFWECLEFFDGKSFAISTQALVRAYVFSGNESTFSIFQLQNGNQSKNLQKLHLKFKILNKKEQQILIDFEEITQFNLSHQAKEINKKMRSIGNLMLQSPHYIRMHQITHSLLFP